MSERHTGTGASAAPAGADARAGVSAPSAVPVLTPLGGGVLAAPHARIIDRSGRKRMPIGREGFLNAMGDGTLVDKTMLIADVLDSGYAATLFCRPRRFGKTMNLTMMKAFFEAPDAGGLTPEQARAAFEHTDIWDADGGAYRPYQGAYPVVHVSLRTAKGESWEETLSALRGVIVAEYQRHDYLMGTDAMPVGEDDYFSRIMHNTASDGEYADSLIRLTRALRRYHGKNVVVLIDEYDAPVMAAYTKGYYDEAVSFLKRWLTGALKDGGEALAFACLTGVQRISKESIFSDLNNLYVSTPLMSRFDERFGFTDDEVAALLTYLGRYDRIDEARAWYDGYRFGEASVYNPWSVISYLNEGCRPAAYWVNTSSNDVIVDLMAHADADTLKDVYTLLEPGGEVRGRLDLAMVFPDLGVRKDAVWSMLYLSGYLTTDDIEDPDDETIRRRLRIPNREIAHIYSKQVKNRFIDVAGDDASLDALHDSVASGDAATFSAALARIAARASAFDLTSERPCHMLLMGLLFGVDGYEDPLSNREAGYGRYDIRLEPKPGKGTAARPLVTVELKHLKPADAPQDAEGLDAALHELAADGLAQIAAKGYDADAAGSPGGRLRWGVAFSGKHVAATSAYVPPGDVVAARAEGGGQG